MKVKLKNIKMKKLILITALLSLGVVEAQVNQDSMNNNGFLNGDKPNQQIDKTKADPANYPSPADIENNQMGVYSNQSNTANGTQQSPQEDLSVPEKARIAFKDAYRDVKAAWTKEEQNFRARFKNNDADALETVVVYDKEGNVIRTEKQIDGSGYPSELAKYYNGQNIDLSNYKVWEVDGKNGTRKYYTSQNDKITWFDKNGKHMTEADHHTAHHGASNYK
jgi:hypothetical protein